jgi:hypothetical protein
MRRLYRPNDGRKIDRFFCNTNCKGIWQRSQKPWDEAWLRQKYEIEGLSANDIARIVGRDAKRVWEWLRDYGIETRTRAFVASRLSKKGRPSSFKGRKHTAETKEKLRQLRKQDGRYPKAVDGRPYWAGKSGPQHPGWKGGVTPERPALYASREWKDACKIVWRRADAHCERCGKDHRKIDRSKEHFHIHHVMPFILGIGRADPSNLVLLCEDCHRWVHSPRNGDRQFLPPFGVFPIGGKLVRISYFPKQKMKLPDWLRSQS